MVIDMVVKLIANVVFKARFSCLQGDLTSGEIIEQLVHARALSPIRNVVFMGMGVCSLDVLSIGSVFDC
jgi:hypothetical protein